MIDIQQRVSNALTGFAPGAATDGASYFMAWASGTDQSLWWTRCPATAGQTGYAWAPQQQIPNAASSDGPTLAADGATVWMAWKGENTDTRIFLASLSQSKWSAQGALSNFGTSASPALAVTASTLFLVFKGESDNQIYWSKSSDGKTWSAQQQVPGASSTDSPAIIGFNGTIWVAWKGESDNGIHWITLSSAATSAAKWGTAQVTSSAFLTSAGPALTVDIGGTLLHLVWKGASDNTIWTANFDVSTQKWTSQTQIAVVETSARPALAPQVSAATDILLAFKGATTDDIWAAPLDGLLSVQLYTFHFASFRILNTRSGNILSNATDTDYVSFGLTVGEGTPQIITQSMGNLSNAAYPVNLAFGGIAIADDERVVVTYQIINSSAGESAATTYLQQTGLKLANAGAQAAATAVGDAIGTAIGAALGIAIPVPVVGSALGALAGWLLSSAWGVAFPNCDGPVAAGIRTFTGADLRQWTATTPFEVSENHPGVNSPSGCGSNSNYDTDWVAFLTQPQAVSAAAR